MTYEYAVYFKLLLLCGYKDDLQQYLDTALLMENPLSDIVLELSTPGTRCMLWEIFFLRQKMDISTKTIINVDLTHF